MEGGEDFGMGTTRECFQSRGTRPEEMDKLKMRRRGLAMEEAVARSIHEEMPSGLEAVLAGRVEISETMSSSEQRSELGQGEGKEVGGMGERVGAEELKQVENKWLRHQASSKSDSAVEPGEEREGIEEDDLRRDLTKDQNFEGGA